MLTASMSIAIAPSFDGVGVGVGVGVPPCRLDLPRPARADAVALADGPAALAAAGVGLAAVAAEAAFRSDAPPTDIAACAPAESGGESATLATASVEVAPFALADSLPPDDVPDFVPDAVASPPRPLNTLFTLVDRSD